MNERERFLATLTYGTPDKVPMMTMGPRESTIAAWETQGLPAGQNWFAAMCAQLSITYEVSTAPWRDLGVDFRMMPTFEEIVLEHRDGHYLVQDWMGNITEIADRYDYTFIRNARDFVTRKWHAFPVSNPAQFSAMRQRYRLDEPGRFPADLADRVQVLARRDYVHAITVSGPFWQLREWCGFEPLCIAFADEPDFVADMVLFWSDFITRMLERIFDVYVPDQLLVNEDMAYKGASMISPAMVREHLLPVWQRWTALARQAGVPIISIDSDGNIDELIPLWIEAGFTVNTPIEVAAGCDLVDYHARYGRQMAYAGGIDKRCIARGGQELEAEMARLLPLVRRGGYLPGCDHGMPPDISWPNLLHFGQLWAEMTGWV